MTLLTFKKVPFLLVMGVCAITLLLRFGLATVNREANDNHQTVIHLIMTESRLPQLKEDWEGFQPKLYHWTFAQIFLLFRVSSNDVQLVIIQYLNSLLGLCVLWMIWDVLRRMPIGNDGRLWTFVLMASNPCLIAIFAQGTNDGFVIFFVTLAAYAALRYFKTGDLPFFGLMAIATIGAGLSKGNGLVVIPVLLGMFCFRVFLAWRNGNYRSVWVQAGLVAVWAFLFLLIVPHYGQYIQRYRQTGEPFITNAPADPLPTLWSYGQSERPGVVSLVGSYLSFPFLDLLQTPIINTDSSIDFPIQRTSLWAQLYGQMNFVHFAQWPKSWKVDSPFIRWLGRCIFILALFPTICVVIWFLRSVFVQTRSLIQKHSLSEETILHILLICAFFVFIFLYTWESRDFSTMKPIFLLPAVLSMAFFLGGALNCAFQAVKNRYLRGVMHGALCMLVVLFGVDLFSLILHLTAGM